MLYDSAGRRTQLTWSDGRYVTYDYDGASRLKTVKESGSTVLDSYGFDAIGRRTSITRGNGVVTSYSGYTPLGVGTMTIDLAGTANDLTLGFAYNPAGQISSRTSTSSNNAWSFGEAYGVNRAYSANSLNQYTASGAIVPTYDTKGNLTSAGSPVYAYSTKNELSQRTDSGATFYHDPLGQLDTITAAGTTTKLQYDGPVISTELNGTTNAILKRYVHGSGDDEPLVQYEGTDFTTRRYLVADERGSIIAVTDDTGNPVAINAYDEHGIPASTNQGRFQYTGQAWIPELGMYSYKARVYSPTLGRFLQTDPAGYPDGPNWYAYTRNDPINGRDASGLGDGGEIIVNAPSSGSGGSYDYSGGVDSYGIFEMAAAIANAVTYQANLAAAQAKGGRQSKACSAARTAAGNLAKGFENLETTFAIADVAAGLTTAAASAGEIASAGADTPLTVAAGSATVNLGLLAFASGAAAAALQTFANGGDPSAVLSFGFSGWVGSRAGMVAEAIPGLGMYAKAFDFAASKSAGLATQVKTQCGGG